MTGFANMIRTRKTVQAWQKRFDALAPQEGDMAPDFELRDVNGEGDVCLSDLREKPVALVFGSFT